MFILHAVKEYGNYWELSVFVGPFISVAIAFPLWIK